MIQEIEDDVYINLSPKVSQSVDELQHLSKKHGASFKKKILYITPFSKLLLMH